MLCVHSSWDTERLNVMDIVRAKNVSVGKEPVTLLLGKAETGTSEAPH